MYQPAWSEPLLRPWACLIGTALILLAAMALPRWARAEEHALIFWIGQYADARIRIAGLNQDGQLARGMARSMGIPEKNITEMSNQQLTHAGITAALAALQARIRPGDSVMVYFSGHGQQRDRVLAGGGCSEGLATYEGGVYYDILLRGQLEALANTARRVVMFNDSCHSGGAATKSFSANTDTDVIAKAYPQLPDDRQNRSGEVAKGSSEAVDPGYSCGVVSNPVAKAFGGAVDNVRERMVYLAASAADEAAYASSQGSIATRAWSVCMAGGRNFDADRDAWLSANELANCAQGWVKKNAKYTQTITLVGNGRMLLSGLK